MKKLVALVLAGAMLLSLPAMAAGSPSAAQVAQDAKSAQEIYVEQAAASQGMTVAEYKNNAITSLPGMNKSDVTPIGQGGHVIINGAPSNIVFGLSKPNAAEVASAKALGGKLLNVVKTNACINKFQSAVVNFWLQGVEFGDNVKVMQLVNGVWVEVPVVEIREDHVVINMSQHGLIAFVEMPAVAQ